MADSAEALTALEVRILQDMDKLANDCRPAMNKDTGLGIAVIAAAVLGLFSLSLVGVLVGLIGGSLFSWWQISSGKERETQSRNALWQLCREPSQRPIILSAMRKLRGYHDDVTATQKFLAFQVSYFPFKLLLEGSAAELIERALAE